MLFITTHELLRPRVPEKFEGGWGEEEEERRRRKSRRLKHHQAVKGPGLLLLLFSFFFSSRRRGVFFMSFEGSPQTFAVERVSEDGADARRVSRWLAATLVPPRRAPVAPIGR